jgi:hypothetical protein
VRRDTGSNFTSSDSRRSSLGPDTWTNGRTKQPNRTRNHRCGGDAG